MKTLKTAVQNYENTRNHGFLGNIFLVRIYYRNSEKVMKSIDFVGWKWK